MGGHVCALQHLSEVGEGAYDALDDLECGLGALAESVGQAVGVVGIRRHAAVRPVAVHTAAVPTHTSIHVPAEARIGRCISPVRAIPGRAVA